MEKRSRNVPLFCFLLHLLVQWDINSVGLECYLDRVEVTGSNPVCPTISHLRIMFSVYALYSKAFNKIYIGFSSDVEKRLASHNDERNTGWTSKYQPWKLVYTEACQTKTEALARERQLKSSRGRDFIRRLLAD